MKDYKYYSDQLEFIKDRESQGKSTKMMKDSTKVIKDRLNALKSELKQLTTLKLTKRCNEERVLELRLRISELYWVLDKIQNG